MEEMQRVSYGRSAELLCPQELPPLGTSTCSPLQELLKPSPLSFYEGFIMWAQLITSSTTGINSTFSLSLLSFIFRNWE